MKLFKVTLYLSEAELKITESTDLSLNVLAY